jgi:hypothetical protein
VLVDDSKDTLSSLELMFLKEYGHVCLAWVGMEDSEAPRHIQLMNE